MNISELTRSASLAANDQLSANERIRAIGQYRRDLRDIALPPRVARNESGAVKDMIVEVSRLSAGTLLPIVKESGGAGALSAKHQKLRELAMETCVYSIERMSSLTPPAVKKQPRNLGDTFQTKAQNPPAISHFLRISPVAHALADVVLENTEPLALRRAAISGLDSLSAINARLGGPVAWDHVAKRFENTLYALDRPVAHELHMRCWLPHNTL